MENKIIATEELLIISRKVLFYAYLILPLFIVTVLVDMFYFDFSLLPHLGVEALFSPFFIIIFLLPHIIASFFSFFNREYVRYYSKDLFIYLPLLLIGTALLLYYNFVWGLLFFLLNDIWHGVRQQVGIGLILGAKPGIIHRLWTLVPFVTASIAYVYILRPSAYPEVLVPYISPALFVGILLIILITAVNMWVSPATVRWYIFAVSMLFICSYFFILTEYIFLSILAFRFVHDISAFAFYMTHDYNCAKSGYRNYFYSLISRIPLHVMLLTPVLGVGIAYLIRVATAGLTIGYSIIILICMSHFYLESVMWKRGTPHRQFVKVG